tara:strand:- start:1874 stop:2155 length:282 start_codon:yes stop_codon:yes gene_type:complete
MLKTNNNEVAKSWGSSRKATSHTGAYWTDGKDLYSYNLRIGTTTKEGSKVLLDFTAGAGHYQSQTTSTHVGKARRYANAIMSPSVASGADSIK